MELLLLYILLVVLSATIASRRGQNVLVNVILALVLSPVMSIIIALIMKRRDQGPGGGVMVSSIQYAPASLSHQIPKPTQEPDFVVPDNVQVIPKAADLAAATDNERALMAAIEREAIACLRRS